ncbi:isochorismate synthase [Melghiribacillus thermohalophilus]|uniref:Isochorismate synthase MenF n=1 Tax=Melghiribacillus thermohalophilus TaxID=1324956 RepID=A0A4V2V0R0_9BACI|nr:isochorismate synthase [Melghiribacillus thermohalophilus]TCT17527.1 isochorismate synthase [Melghiribacillus thermohalophilus]
MVEIEEQLSGLIQKLKRDQRNFMLLSYTEKILFQDPIAFFENGKALFEKRFFWSSADQDFSVVGLGSVARLTGSQDRFMNVEEKWHEILTTIFIENPYTIPGTGPVIMGGFSFHEQEQLDGIWADFEHNEMVLPQIILTNYRGNSYITHQIPIRVEQTAEKIMEQINEHRLHTLKPRSEMRQAECILKQDLNPDAWKDLVKFATDEIKKGSFSKVVLARELRATYDQNVSPASVLMNLVEEQHHSYIYAFESNGTCFVGASPERLVKVEDNCLLSTCLAGTAPRGGTVSEDEKIGQELLKDRKNLQEHAYVVDMIRQAVESCCDEVDIPDGPVLLPLKNLQHLYTPVRGKLKEGKTLLHVVKQLHPTPALGGEPRNEALHFIRQYERLNRGWYAGPVGWMDASGNGEFAVAIRSALLNGNQASLFAGCGIVRDSDPEEEFKETEIKLTPMLSALGGWK